MKNFSFASVFVTAIAAASASSLAVATTSCTPAEQQAVAKGVENAAQCIETNSVPGADPKSVAITCALNSTPDLIAIITSVIHGKLVAQQQLENCTVIMVDAGAPDGAGK